MAKIYDMTDPGAAAAGIAAAAAALRDGRLVGMPTETVYGLAADAGSPAAVAAIFAAKRRPSFNPLIVHVPDLARARTFAEFSEDAERLAEAFWPGPLTLVLPLRAGAGLAPAVTAGLPTVALRVPAHPVAAMLLAASGLPLAAPSANRSGRVSPTAAAHVEADLGDRVAVILDAGPTAVGLESAIVSLGEGGAVLLRPGGLSRERIEAVIGRKLREAKSGGEVVAPGMLASHYAPSVPLRMDAATLREGESLLAFAGQRPPGAAPVAVVDLSPAGDLAEAASRLYAALRDLDSVGAPIAVAPIPSTGLGEAINDRLRRAAAPRG